MNMQATTVERGTREFNFSDKDFRYIKKIVHEHSGIALSDAKQDLVYGRLSRRLRHHGMTSFRDYCALLTDTQDDTEFGEFINAITTNLTSFFRENHHFEFMAGQALPALMEANRVSRRLRIWSAGCSTGEEPYSIAMVVAEQLPADWDVRILATDLDSSVVERAAAAVYPLERVEGVTLERKRRWMMKGGGGQRGLVRMRDELRDMITFNKLNLMHDWPFKGPFDLILCRNVVIYFDKDTQRVLFERFANVINPRGYLFLGHSETLHNVSTRFDLLGKTVYQVSA
ncbi:MAG: protein-glutamate O-methyltransferase [Gammaproteobacteria bacterium]|nr:protein-glutamate O-methyltransferase [Gammaproteobacteria bacterium]